MLALEWDKNLALQARFDDGFDSGLESVAIKMIKHGKSFEEIQSDTDLPLERIEQLAKKILN